MILSLYESRWTCVIFFYGHKKAYKFSKLFTFQLSHLKSLSTNNSNPIYCWKVVNLNMLMAERDDVWAEVDNLQSEMRNRDIQIKKMEERSC